MIKAVREKKRRKKRVLLVGLFVVLLAAAGTISHQLSLSLQDVNRIIQLAVGKISNTQEPVVPEEAVVRGTIYDRTMQELSVSYQLYTLVIHPVELTEREKVARSLSEIIGKDRQEVFAQLKSMQPMVELADDLDQQQVKNVESLKLAGVYCKPREERYYPAHSAAAHLLGFTDKGIGLAGVEALYDPVLHQGIFRQEEVPELDFNGETSLGRKTADLVLTLDLDLQKNIEEQLGRYWKDSGAWRAMALVMEPASGKILAIVSHPGFDPNYFWQANEQATRDQILQKIYLADLIRPLFQQAAEIYDTGISKQALPVTIRAPESGSYQEKIQKYWQQFGLTAPVAWQCKAGSERATPPENHKKYVEKLSGAQLVVGLASLINGGTRVSPYVLENVYDHDRGKMYARNAEAGKRQRVIPPAEGVHLRMKLLAERMFSRKHSFMFVGRTSRVVRQQEATVYYNQELLFAAVPREKPKVVMLMAVDHDRLYPLSPKMYRRKRNDETLAYVGRHLLPSLTKASESPEVTGVPLLKNEKNYQRFLISRRLEQPAEHMLFAEKQHAMPDITGMSLRKGLRRINGLNLEVTIQGSGRIVRQEPAPGTALADARTCRLTLESRI